MQTVVPITPEVCPPEQDEPPIICFRDVATHDDGKVAYKTFMPLDGVADSTVIVVPGYLGIQPPYECLGEDLARTNRNAIILRPLRRHNLINRLHPSHITDPLRLPSQVLWSVIKDSKQKYEVENFDILAHSMGGPITMKMVDANPEAARSVLLVGSAGLDGHSMASLAIKLPKALLEIVPAIPKFETDRRRAARHILHHTLQDPLRTISEGLAVANIDIKESIRTARQNDVKIGRLQFKSDPLFPTDNISEADKAAVDLYEEYPDPGAGHMALILQHKDVASLSATMINTMTS